jgi:hypothetical protein
VDALIVVTSLILLAMEKSKVELLNSLRVLRAIKPLRALTRSAGMQLIFKSVSLSLAAMANVSLVVLLLMLIFAILGVQLFHGKFQYCSDPSIQWRSDCIGTFKDDAGQVSLPHCGAPASTSTCSLASWDLYWILQPLPSSCSA